MWQEGFLPGSNSLPGLFKQERESLTLYLNILFKLYYSPKEKMDKDALKKKLFEYVDRRINIVDNARKFFRIK